MNVEYLYRIRANDIPPKVSSLCFAHAIISAWVFFFCGIIIAICEEYNMKKYALASDFDNTLHFRDGKFGYIKDVDRQAIQRFRKEGSLFGICTGRPLIGLLNEVRDNLEVDFNIVSTGSLICEFDEKNTPIYQKTITKERALDMIHTWRGDVDFYLHADGLVYTFEGFRHAYPSQIVLQDESELDGKVITGMSGHTTGFEVSEKIVAQMSTMYDDVSIYQNNEWMDVVPLGVSKGTAILELKKMWNIDVFGFIGDGRNDIPSLQAADVSFTFPYATDDVKAEADYIVESVAEAIEVLKKM